MKVFSSKEAFTRITTSGENSGDNDTLRVFI